MHAGFGPQLLKYHWIYRQHSADSHYYLQLFYNLALNLLYFNLLKTPSPQIPLMEFITFLWYPYRKMQENRESRSNSMVICFFIIVCLHFFNSSASLLFVFCLFGVLFWLQSERLFHHFIRQ